MRLLFLFRLLLVNDSFVFKIQYYNFFQNIIPLLKTQLTKYNLNSFLYLVPIYKKYSIMCSINVISLRPLKQYLSTVQIKVQFIMCIVLTHKIIKYLILPHFLILNSLHSYSKLQPQIISSFHFFQLQQPHSPFCLIDTEFTYP